MADNKITIPFALYVIHHPQSEYGAEIASHILDHFGTERFRYAIGGMSIPVIFRYMPAPDSEVPLPVDWNEAEATAAIIILDKPLADSPQWFEYAKMLEQQAENIGLNTRTFFVALSNEYLKTGIETQAVRWDIWHGNTLEKTERLIRDLSCEFSRMIRHILSSTKLSNNNDQDIDQYTRDIEVFLSHSKHDDYGETVAEKIRTMLNQNGSLKGFLDVKDTKSGLSYDRQFQRVMATGVTVLVHTDSYSSREFCRKEVLLAKQLQAPIILVNCLKKGEERAFPYMGNIPTIRIDPESTTSFEPVYGSIADEILKHLLWKCHTQKDQTENPFVAFMPRPPELLSLTNLKERLGTDIVQVVYPEPPLGIAELSLLEGSNKNIRFLSLNQWLSERGL